MSKLTRQGGLALVFCLLSLLLVPPLQAANEVFLSNDTAQSEATYVIQFGATLSASVDKIRVALPPGTNAANAALGRLILGDKESEALMTVDPLNPDALIMDLPHAVAVKPGVGILVELFNLNNPVAGNYAIDVRTVDKNGNVIEVIPPIAFSTFPVGTGDITAVNAGTGLQGGGTNGDVTLSVNTSVIQSRVTGVCAAGSSIRAVDGNGNVTCEADDNSGGTVTSVGTGSGLTGGPITTTGTISVAPGGIASAMLATDSVDSSKILDGSIGAADVNSLQIQLRVQSSCAAGSSIRSIDHLGGVICEPDDVGAGVTAVTASTPLTSSGGATPIISLPNVIVGPSNTAIGSTALDSNTSGFNNTASGALALTANTSGLNNTASGAGALLNNNTGNSNTASGAGALLNNNTGGGNTAMGNAALLGNSEGSNNTAIGAGANVSFGNLTNATAIGKGAIVDASNKIRLGNGDVTLVEGAGFVKGLSGLCIANDCKTAWPAGTVTGVTASAPLTSSGGTAPNIRLPNVIIEPFDSAKHNTAIGAIALPGNTGGDNTAIGFEALRANSSGSFNTASGVSALAHNTAGIANTAIGFEGLRFNTVGNDNTAIGHRALWGTSSNDNTAIGFDALKFNTLGNGNTAIGVHALSVNDSGNGNTAIGHFANVTEINLTNATAIGAVAHVDASNKVRLGNTAVTVIEGQVPFTSVSDKNQKENFKPMDGEEVLKKIREVPVQSWNFIGHDPKQFRHYGPMAQDFFAAFGNDGVGTIGTPTTINSGDMAGILMIAVQALEKQNRDLKARVEALEQMVKDRPYLTASSVPVQ